MPNRVEREIEEIMAKLETPAPGRAPVRLRRSWRSRVRRTLGRVPRPRTSLTRLNAGSMMLWGIGLILAALLLRMVSAELTRWAVILGLILFFGAFVVGFLHEEPGSFGSGETYWRGQRFSRSELRGPSTVDRLKTWWRTRNRRRW